MAHAPVVGFLVDSTVGLIGNLLVVIVKEGIASRGLEPLGNLIVDTESPTPTVHGLGVVACTHFSLEPQAPLLGELLLDLEREVKTEIVGLR